MSLQEDAKKILPFVQAMAEGKTVEFRHVSECLWRNKLYADSWDNCSYVYRIKPEKKRRPYTREEWERVVRVRYKANGHSVPVGQIGNEIVWLGSSPYTFEEAFFKYTHLDGTPCGVEVEE